MREPFVSVVTPFYNTAPYLAQCIESVLAQSYRNFEYLLVDNCSTDGSTEIAESFARQDDRVHLIRQPRFLSQVQNYNSALDRVSPQSRYCKLVQADDSIFPDCLTLMVQVFERSESVGLVSSYWLKGNEVRGSGFPFAASIVCGKDVVRMYLRTGLWVFASPSAVMYRSSLIKNGQPFYDESQLHEDTQKCMEILKDWNFGFVPQVLSFSRLDNESISSAVRGFQPDQLDRYIAVQRHAATFLEPDEAASLKQKSRRNYYRMLAQEKLRGREAAFWKYHTRGLATLGETMDASYLARQIGLELLWTLGNPVVSVARALGVLKRKLSLAKSEPKAAATLQLSPEKIAAPVAEPTHAVKQR